MASFSSGVELGHRAAVGRGRRGGRSGRSRSRPSPRGAAAMRAGAAALEDALLAGAPDRRARWRRRRPARCPAARARRSSGEVLLVGRVLAGEARRAHAGRAAERGGLDARVVAERRARRSPRPRRAPWAARSRRTSRPSRAAARRRRAAARPRSRRAARANSRTLCGVARGEDQPHAPRAPTARSCAACSSLDRPCRRARAASSRCARDSGVRSAVAWTSMRPPSPVMTTLASTSAVESSA